VTSDTAPHPAEASLWERFLARENLAEALRRVEQTAGAAGIDGMSTKELRPWLKVAPMSSDVRS
jgi:retron-type reverse transcriptase